MRDEENEEKPIEWRRLSIGEIADVTKLAGYEFTEHINYVEDGEIIALRALNLKEGKLDLTQIKRIKKSVSDFLIRSKLNRGDLVFSYVGTIGEVAVINESGKFHLAPNIAKITFKESFNCSFFSHYFRSSLIKGEINRFLTTTSQPALSMGNIRQIQVLVPSSVEQQKIAEILSTVDEKIEVVGEQISQTRELKQGLMQHLLTTGIGHTQFKDSPAGKIPMSWEDLTFGDIVKFSGGAQPPRSTFIHEAKEGYIRLIQTRDYKTDKYKTYIPEESARKQCKTDDIMIGRYGPPIFQILRGLEGAYNVALMKAIPNKSKLNKEYLYYYISQYKVWAFVENLSQRSGGQTGVDLDQLKKYPFPLPPIPEQQKIADILSTVDEKLEVLQDKKQQYQELKRGLMQQLLTGKVRVTNLLTKVVPA